MESKITKVENSRWEGIKMDSERWFNLGVDEVKRKNFEAAKGMFENALKINREYIEAHEELAITNLHLGDFDSAIDIYDNLLKINFKQDYKVKKAGLKLLSGKPNESERLFEEVLRDDNTNLDALKGLADSFYKQMKFDQAHEIYDKLIDINPDNSFYWFCKAETYYKAQDHEKSFVAIEKAIELEEAPEYFCFKGDFFIRHESFERALEQYIIAAQINPNDPELRVRLGIIYRVLDREKDAIYSFDKALKINPFEKDAFINKIEIYEKQGKTPAALALKEKYVRLVPKDLEFGENLVDYYIENKGYERAVELLEILIKEHNENDLIWAKLSFILFEIEEFERALQSIKKAMTINKENHDYILFMKKIESKIKK